MIFSLLDTPAYGGAEEYLLTVLFHLERSGHRVLLATNNFQVKQECEGKIAVIDLPYRLDAIGNWKGLVKYFLALPGALLWLVQTIRKYQIDICLFPGFTDRLSFSPIVKGLGCRLIWLEYGPLEPTFQRNYGFPKLLYALGKPFPDRIVTISEWTERSLVHIGKMPKEKIKIIYPGVQFSAQRMAHSKQKNTQFTVATVARLAKEKEIDLLLRAWAKVDREKAKLIIIGDGPERENLKKLAESLHVSQSVTFTGFVSNEKKEQLLRASDLFVFPSAWELEGFGMTTIEAMAVGLPIITTGYGPQEEIVIDGKNGWYFHLHDADDMAKKIQIVIKSSHLQTFADESKRMVKQKFSRESMLSAWENLIGNV